MPLHHYGVLKGSPISSRVGLGNSPHYQIHMVDDMTDYRIAINVKSKLSPSELLYLVDDDFQHPITETLADLEVGYTLLASAPAGAALDFIRGNLFDRAKMKALPHNVPGPDNDLNEKIGAYVSRSVGDKEATVYAFGERWGPENNKKDKHFGFLPGNGVHDIHMNQGNVGRFKADDGVWQDGALFLHFPEIIGENGDSVWPEQWVAMFLSFQSQSWHTDDQTGHALEAPAPVPTPTPTPTREPGERDGHVRVVAALVNPESHDPGHESVTLLNTTPVPVELQGWSIVDRNKNRTTLDGPTLPAGDSVRIVLDGNGAQLGNKGGIITLLDAGGIKIDGVAYTRNQARKERWTLVF